MESKSPASCKIPEITRIPVTAWTADYRAPAESRDLAPIRLIRLYFKNRVSLRELEATVARCLYPYRMIPKEHLGRRRPADKFFRERLRTAIPNFAPLIQKRPFCDILTTPAPFTKRAPKLSHA